jgi:hypothetical protein
MSNEEQDAIVGKTLRERNEAVKRLAALVTKAQKIGDALSRLGNDLQGSPENVIFDQQPHDVRFGAKDGYVFHKKDLNADEIYALCDEIRKTKIESDRLTSTLINMGIENPKWPPATY